MAHRILILDDEPKMGALLERSLAREGYEAVALTDPREAIERIKAEPFDVLVTDLRMPGLDGIEVLTRTRAASPRTEVILMTAFASVETAREALKRGAVDYLVKPVSAENDLKPLLERLLRDNPAEDPALPMGRPAATPPTASVPASPARVAPVGASPPIKAVLDKIERIARSNATVLLRGESGTGKEVFADLIQTNSPRATKPYLKINCGALAETLLESELFGHARGSFTGAVAERDGIFAAANGGTLLLDEIGEVSPALQVKLLRVLQSGEYTRVGENTLRRCDVRVLAATNRDLERMVEEGTFRQDLYYRLNVVPVDLPPLRERPEDIGPLVDHFSRRFAPEGTKVHFSEEAMRALKAYGWPGNIRELENAVEHALVLGNPEKIGVDDLPAAVQDHERRLARGGAAASAQAVGSASLEEIEQRCLLTALEKTRGNRTRAAALLGITRRTLGYRLRKYGLEEDAARLASRTSRPEAT